MKRGRERTDTASNWRKRRKKEEKTAKANAKAKAIANANANANAADANAADANAADAPRHFGDWFTMKAIVDLGAGHLLIRSIMHARATRKRELVDVGWVDGCEWEKKKKNWTKNQTKQHSNAAATEKDEEKEKEEEEDGRPTRIKDRRVAVSSR